MKPARLMWVFLLFMPLLALAQVAAGYPRDYAATIAAAKREGKLVIYASTDRAAASYLIRDFGKLYPGIEIDYQESNSAELYHRFVKETASESPSADVLWSSAMDLQVKLVNDAYALHYLSPEIAQLPEWAVWKNEAYGTTFEPVVFAYNTRGIRADEVPRTHIEFAKLIESDPGRFHGKLITYDLERAGLGFLFAARDVLSSNAFWDIARLMGAAEVRLQTSTATMLESVASGESLLAYNLLGSYAYNKSRTDPSIGFVFPRDYTLIVSRVAFINRRAANPNAAKLWLDYLLSQRGQSVLANQAGLFAIRRDVAGDNTASFLTRSLGASLRPIPIGPSLMAYLDRSKREALLKQWRHAISATKQASD